MTKKQLSLKIAEWICLKSRPAAKYFLRKNKTKQTQPKATFSSPHKSMHYRYIPLHLSLMINYHLTLQ